MNKNKIYLALAVLSVTGMIGQYVYYENIVQVDAQLNTYTLTYSSTTEARQLIQEEEAKGCSKIHHDFTKRDGTEGILTFTCDSRAPPPVVLTQMTSRDFINMLAAERNVEIIP